MVDKGTRDYNEDRTTDGLNIDTRNGTRTKYSYEI